MCGAAYTLTSPPPAATWGRPGWPACRAILAERRNPLVGGTSMADLCRGMAESETVAARKELTRREEGGR